MDAPKKRFPWPECLIEAFGLGVFMISACSFGVLLFHPGSAIARELPDPLLRRFLMGCAMALTAITLVYSPWGRRSGAHFNPAVTLAFHRLGKVTRRDLLAYGAAQFAGAAGGVLLASRIWGPWLADRSVRYVVTEPGPTGPGVAFLAEGIMTFILFSVVVRVANHPRWMRATGLIAGALVAAYITFESPLSGMSLNPARSFGSASVAMEWRVLWIYFLAPPLGMLLAAEVFLRRRRPGAPFCAKMIHDPAYRCLFCETSRARESRLG